ncbi:MAG: hypothetical protein QME74_00235, partial [Candidatus Edwardsbacteria bacterium]|nr:hypothetical protein [Candidatus Edwardsbacteria bacterium]
YPDRIEIGEQFAVRAALRNVRGRLVLALREDDRIVSRAEAGPGAASATLTARAASPGLHRYLLTMARDGETVDSRSFAAMAVASRIKVSWLDFAPGWNLRFFSQAVSNDPGITLSAYLKRGGGWVRAGEPRPVPAWPDSAVPCDVLVISGADGAQAPPRLTQLIERGVLEPGGGVLVIGGISLQALALPLQPQGPAVSGEVALEQAWRQSGLFPVGDASLESRIRKGPPMAVPARLARADSAALVLASLQTPKAGRMPLWAWKYAGRGRMMQFASGDLWKWKPALAGAQRDTMFYDQLILSLVRWLAGREGGAFTLAPERSIYLAGDEVALRGRWQRWEERDRGAAQWSLTVAGPSGYRATRPLSDWGGGDYAAELDGLRPGPYSYRATFALAGRVMNQQQGAFYVEPGQDESRDLTQNKGLLAEIAAVSGGRYFDADSLPADDAWLRAIIAADAGQRPREGLVFVLLAVVSLLAAEWAVRRWHGLR